MLSLLKGFMIRLFQVIALYIPGATTVRVWLHRSRGVTIGKDVFIGTSVILETSKPELIYIGDNTAISIRSVVVAHFREMDSLNTHKKKYSIKIGSDVFIGPGALILPDVTIGDGAVVAAGSVVNTPVAPKTMVQGNPAKPVAMCELPLIPQTSYKDFIRHLKPIKHSKDKRN